MNRLTTPPSCTQRTDNTTDAMMTNQAIPPMRMPRKPSVRLCHGERSVRTDHAGGKMKNP